MGRAEDIVNSKYIDIKIQLKRYKDGLISEDDFIKYLMEKLGGSING